MSKTIESVKRFIRSVSWKEGLNQFILEVFKRPLRLIFYPIKSVDEYKQEKKYKLWVAWFYLGMMILTRVIAYNGEGFLVNKNNPRDFNLFLIVSLVVFPVFISVIANWATTALMDGKGTMKEIFMVITYAFFPYVWLGLASTLISNFITVDEIIFYTFFQSLGIFLTGFLIFFGLLGIHEYGLGKTILMVIATIVAIAATLFIILLFFSLIQQVWAFLESIYDEFVMRFL